MRQLGLLGTLSSLASPLGKPDSFTPGGFLDLPITECLKRLWQYYPPPISYSLQSEISKKRFWRAPCNSLLRSKFLMLQIHLRGWGGAVLMENKTTVFVLYQTLTQVHGAWTSPLSLRSPPPPTPVPWGKNGFQDIGHQMMKDNDLSLRGGKPREGSPYSLSREVSGCKCRIPVAPGVIPELRQNWELGRPSWLELQDLVAERKELDRVGTLEKSIEGSHWVFSWVLISTRIWGKSHLKGLEETVQPSK